MTGLTGYLQAFAAGHACKVNDYREKDNLMLRKK